MGLSMGTKIKDLREKSGMTQTELANKLGLSKSVISAYEKGIRNPSFKILPLLAQTFNVTELYFFDCEKSRVCSDGRIRESICIFADGKNQCSHQCAHWCQQQSTGLLHSYGFDSLCFFPKKKPPTRGGFSFAKERLKGV